MNFTEEKLELAYIGLLEELGYEHRHGGEIETEEQLLE
jgi:hypothetical protein